MNIYKLRIKRIILDLEELMAENHLNEVAKTKINKAILTLEEVEPYSIEL